jgi:hypothetical protein
VQRRRFCLAICLALLGAMVLSSPMLHAQSDDGPLGLRWGMSTEAVERMGLGLCCRQVGKWGARYEVNQSDFANFPAPLGDEDKVYLYFGNTNKLLRAFIAIQKQDGWNRYKQMNILAARKYDLIDQCVREQFSKYETLKKRRPERPCSDYEAYSVYKKDGVEAFVGLEKHGAAYRISVILLHNELFRRDKGKKNPL